MENPFDTICIQLKEIKQAQEEIYRKLDELKRAGSNEDELIPRLEKAKQLNVSPATLNNWERAGIIQPVRLGRKVFFRKSEAHPKARPIHRP